MINIILACDNEWGIGLDNNLQYHFAKDLKRFKELTSGKTVVMGRKTWESLPNKLPNRKNIVISRSKELDRTPDFIFDSIEPVIELSKSEDIWIIGGAEICQLFMPYISTIELTIIDSTRKSDTNIGFIEKELLNFYINKAERISDLDKVKGEELNLQFLTYKRKNWSIKERI